MSALREKIHNKKNEIRKRIKKVSRNNFRANNIDRIKQVPAEVAKSNKQLAYLHQKECKLQSGYQMSGKRPFDTHFIII